MRRLLLSTTALLAAAAFARAETFERVATFPVAEQGREGETVAEIVAATDDGTMLVYTDGAQGGVGLIDLSDPASPTPAGFIETGGEPTSVVVAKNMALVGVNTSESFTEPGGDLVSIDMASKARAGEPCDLGGQPDALALSSDGTRLAVAIENERDEDLNDGAIPQAPAGDVVLLDVREDGTPDCASLARVDLTGLAEVAPSDPEPEFVAFDASGDRVAVSLQENNHIAVIDAASGEIVSDFSAGEVTLEGVDATRDGVIDPSETLSDVKREPDAIAWLGDDRIVTANEGDYEGGSRGFTIFSTTGEVLHDSGAELEDVAIRLGHYPEARAGKKGVEPEGVAVAAYGDETLVFVGLERASLVLVYRDAEGGPEFVEALSPGGVGPEGILPLPDRGILVVASETDLREDGGVGSLVTVFERREGASAYPTIRSREPIGFGALSGLVADPEQEGTLYAVSDSFYDGAPAVYTIDAATTPATITAKTLVTENGAPAVDLDLEGITMTPGGGFYVVSEGNPERDENKTDSQLLKLSADGAIERRIDMPEALRTNARRFGFEGVTAREDGTVWIAVQREWADDPEGYAKLLAWSPETEKWRAVHYPLDESEAGKGWIGLSEIVADGDGLLVLERDDRIGEAAKVKRIYRVSLEGVEPAAVGAGEPPVVEKTLVRDLLTDLRAGNGPIQDKPEGLAVTPDGTAYLVTDNDGGDDASGETRFIALGAL